MLKKSFDGTYKSYKDFKHFSYFLLKSSLHSVKYRDLTLTVSLLLVNENSVQPALLSCHRIVECHFLNFLSVFLSFFYEVRVYFYLKYLCIFKMSKVPRTSRFKMTLQSGGDQWFTHSFLKPQKHPARFYASKIFLV